VPHRSSNVASWLLSAALCGVLKVVAVVEDFVQSWDVPNEFQTPKKA
jgi:hypothetical protein